MMWLIPNIILFGFRCKTGPLPSSVTITPVQSVHPWRAGFLQICNSASSSQRKKEGSLDIVSYHDPVNVIFVTLPYRIKDYFLKQPTAWLAIFLGRMTCSGKIAMGDPSIIGLHSLLPPHISLGSHIMWPKTDRILLREIICIIALASSTSSHP